MKTINLTSDDVIANRHHLDLQEAGTFEIDYAEIDKNGTVEIFGTYYDGDFRDPNASISISAIEIQDQNDNLRILSSDDDVTMGEIVSGNWGAYSINVND
jgi:hypothetical protein